MKRLISIGIIILFWGCSASQSSDSEFNIIRSVDKSNPDIISCKSTPIKLITGNSTDPTQLDIRFAYESESLSKFFFFISYYDKSWAYLNTMKMVIDGETFEAPGIEPIDRKDLSTGIMEFVCFKISKDIIEKIKTSKTINMKFIGKNRNLDIALNDDIMSKFKKFVFSVPDY